jgi:hypothetical protein
MGSRLLWSHGGTIQLWGLVPSSTAPPFRPCVRNLSRPLFGIHVVLVQCHEGVPVRRPFSKAVRALYINCNPKVLFLFALSLYMIRPIVSIAQAGGYPLQKRCPHRRIMLASSFCLLVSPILIFPLPVISYQDFVVFRTNLGMPVLMRTAKKPTCLCQRSRWVHQCVWDASIVLPWQPNSQP